MLTYDWLKENPQERDSLIKGNWQELFQRDDVSFAMREELLELQKHTSVINDSILFWSQQMLLANLNESGTLYDAYVRPEGVRLMEQLYTVV